MTKVQQKLTTDLESSREIIGRKILFDDTKYSEFNQKNVPTYDATAEVRIHIHNLSGVKSHTIT